MPKKFDILQHDFVPAYRKLEESEITSLLESFSIKRVKLPKLLSSDPIVERLELKAGDVVEITRKSRTAGEAKYYRVVVDA
ncbi:DNA-directed RNA polymerase subunit H [archaeon CG10_big_fil_rev_8_21_14_0_10_43_11]|nr:MAG: DNA-directed RNA polymerase subunit H [archaeon CG10_big_fil_rev_8_21_14_0_10_43_11]